MDKIINKKIQHMILSPEISRENVLRYVKGECQTVQLTPQTLGMLFELYAEVQFDESNPLTAFSAEITIDELKNIHPGFRSTNGCQWARSDGGYLGKKYKIKRIHQGGKVYSIKLDGPNEDSVKKYRGINPKIRKTILQGRCVILDTSVNIEVDHKNGKYNSLTNLELSTQKLSDFQPLSKAANDAKRQHCQICIKTGKRYDARKLGYKEAFIVGDENTSPCPGCYWYDPKRFNEVISKNFDKNK